MSFALPVTIYVRAATVALTERRDCLYQNHILIQLLMAIKIKRAADAVESSRKRARLELLQTLYLNNLNDNINRATLKHNIYLLFSSYGEVWDINMKLRGQAHVVMESKETASICLKALLGTAMFGKPLRIDFSKAKSRMIDQAEKLLAEE